MKNGLSEIRERLQTHPELKTELRGAGKSAFLYIRSAVRAVEVSTGDEGYLLEYWNCADEQLDDAPVRSEDVDSVSEVERKLTEWLAG